MTLPRLPPKPAILRWALIMSYIDMTLSIMETVVNGLVQWHERVDIFTDVRKAVSGCRRRPTRRA